ncbi:MAG: N-acetyltransferase [Thermoleophilaceae bacterium]|nr:N-acetyltransferase [Thermoleophilaceae bacterium]
MGASVTVRDAVPAGDSEACAAIYAPYVRDSYSTFELAAPGAAEMAARISIAAESYAWLVAEVDGAVVGYAYGGPHATRAAYRWACSVSVFVAAQLQGVGIGAALYEALLERLKSLGYLTATAGITIPNAASVALHERFGFREVARYARIGYKLGKWHDVIWMQRDFLPEGADFPVPPHEPGRPRAGT